MSPRLATGVRPTPLTEKSQWSWARVLDTTVSVFSEATAS